MVVPRIQRAPRVKLRIIFLSRPARKRERERHEEPQDQQNCDTTRASQNLQRIGANVAREAELQCKLKSPQWWCYSAVLFVQYFLEN